MKWVFVLQCLFYFLQVINSDRCAMDCTNIVIHKSDSSSICDLKHLGNNFNYTIKDQDVGAIEVQLRDLANCISGDYSIMLEYLPITNKTKCNANLADADRKAAQLHSKLDYSVSDQGYELSSYKKLYTSNVTFQYVFTGCYSLEIKSLGPREYRYKNPVYIETDFKHNFIEERNTVQFLNRTKGNLTITELRINFTSNAQPSIYTLLMETNCPKGCFKLQGTLEQNYSDCSEHAYNMSMNCSYTKDSSDLTSIYQCSITGLKSGRYTMRHVLRDGYICCSLQHPWNYHFCDISHSFDVLEYTAVDKSYNAPEKSDKKHVYIIITVVTVAFIIAILLFRYHKAFRGHSRKGYERSRKKEPPLLPLTYKILIIYARDSDMFMDMMENFKSLLNEVENVTIYDIYSSDPDLCEEPHSWIRSKISDENTLVILFLNKCSVKIFRNKNVTYREPKWQDLLFKYAVTQLKITNYKNYTNFFVTSLSNFFDDLRIFGDLNPAARYAMPININKLLEDIFRYNPNIDNLFINEFSRLCQECIEYEESNPQHIFRILDL